MDKKMVAAGLVRLAKSLAAGTDLAIEKYRFMQAVKEMGREIVRFRGEMKNTGMDRESDQFYLEMIDVLNRFKPVLDKYVRD